MKNFHFLFVLMIAFPCALSCQKDDPAAPGSGTIFQDSMLLDFGQSSVRLSEKYPAVFAQNELNRSAVRFWENVKDLSRCLVAIESISGINTLQFNPLWKDLETVKIVVDGHGTRFSELNLIDKMSFLDAYVENEKYFYSNKILYAPELSAYLDALSDLTEQMFLNPLRQGQMQMPDISVLMELSSKYKLALVGFGTNPEVVSPFRISRSGYEHLTEEQIRSSVRAQDFRRGDLIVRPPVFDSPTTMFNVHILEDDSIAFLPGHTETLVYDIGEERPVFGATGEDGNEIGYNTFEWLNSKAFVLRMIAKRYERGDDGSFASFDEALDTDAYLDVLLQQQGKSFSKVLENPAFFKDVILTRTIEPESFTCSSLVWYAANRAFGIDISNTVVPVISPSGIILDDNTLIVGTIQ